MILLDNLNEVHNPSGQHRTVSTVLGGRFHKMKLFLPEHVLRALSWFNAQSDYGHINFNKPAEGVFAYRAAVSPKHLKSEQGCSVERMLCFTLSSVKREAMRPSQQEKTTPNLGDIRAHFRPTAEVPIRNSTIGAEFFSCSLLRKYGAPDRSFRGGGLDVAGMCSGNLDFLESVALL